MERIDKNKPRPGREREPGRLDEARRILRAMRREGKTTFPAKDINAALAEKGFSRVGTPEIGRLMAQIVSQRQHLRMVDND